MSEPIKVQQLEANLNRVCLQQDALMPLLQIIEYIPAIQRTDGIVKGLIKKIEDNDSRINRIESCFEKKVQDNNTVVQQKKINSKAIDDVQGRVKDIENQMNNLYKWYETKLKEESQTLQRNIEQKLERSKFDVQRSFVNDSFRTGDYNKQLLYQVEQIISHSTDALKQEMQNQLTELYQEMNTIKLMSEK